MLGATGCVGTGVCAAFASAGYEVLAVARRRPSGSVGDMFVPLDVSTADPAGLAGLLDGAGVQVVVNATGGWLTSEDGNERHHVRLVERLLTAAELCSSVPRVVQIGSIHEYGPVPYGSAIDESVVPRPTTPYARTKLAGSRLVLQAARAGRVPAVVLRAVNVLGPGVATASFLGSVVLRLRELPPGGRLPLSIGDFERDFIDVRDLADAAVRAAEAPLTGEVLNIGLGRAVGIRTILSLLLRAAGRDAETIDEGGEPVTSRGGDWTLADTRLARRLLGWAPRIGLQQSVRDMWEAAGR
ncbi:MULTISPECIES: NAD-dependent epimerase/dehydratase family protein [Streptomyces]|uniref:NAD(P)-dependent oxidoreductase n=1 Tax=Streptomyces bugieae TaxID=3098223 RepID=A0ABU7NRZ7_9ACTN|nr:NAD(P)-dependent oxidoreductase [Streptomyces nigrescens]MEE4421641.1 NAD(P)-dependent oxidoreductase [Streptomyces sp. DSM 41528]